mgnify:CR=1 FL=1
MDQRKIDVRLQLKDAPGAGHMFGKKECPRNELVIRLTPNESIFIRANVKAPGLSMAPVQSELDLTYRDRYGDTFKNQPSAYARMILNVRSSSVEFENNANVHSIMSRNFLVTSTQTNQLTSFRALTPIVQTQNKST